MYVTSKQVSGRLAEVECVIRDEASLTHEELHSPLGISKQTNSRMIPMLGGVPKLSIS
jgi:hypothetical protein